MKPKAQSTAARDPRLEPGFDPAHFPLCDGQPPPPPDTADPVEIRQLEFLAAYYRVNRLQARLEAVRRGGGRRAERPLLRDLEAAIRERDRIEDKYEPEGFLGEPLMRGVFCESIEFTHARSGQPMPLAESSRFSLHIPLPPEGADVAAWIARHVAVVMPEIGLAPPGEAPTRGTPPPTPPRQPAEPKPRGPGGRSRSRHSRRHAR
jgi:hypothetical protein